MESTCLSDQEHQADDGTNPYLLRCKHRCSGYPSGSC
jgi:hypothetical protein